MVRMSLKKLMIFMLSVLLVIGVVLTGGCAPGTIETAEQKTPDQVIENVTSQEAFNLIQTNMNNPDFVIVDVRTAEEFADGYIENAINIDFYAKTFRDDLNKLDKDKTYLIYCRSGGRSGNALNTMEELDFKEVYNILGGILGWNAAELPTVK